MADQSTLIEVIKIVAPPAIGFLAGGLALLAQRRKEKAALVKTLKEGTSIDADTSSKYSEMALKWTQEFRSQLSETNKKLGELQTSNSQLTSDISALRADKVQLEMKNEEFHSKLAIMEKQKIDQDIIIESQRIRIAQLANEMKILKRQKSRRPGNATSSNKPT